jgi:hypothetical protein
MCASRVTRHTSMRYSSSCHTRVNMGASIFFTAAMIRAYRQPSNTSSCQKKLYRFFCGCEQFHYGRSFGFLILMFVITKHIMKRPVLPKVINEYWLCGWLYRMVRRTFSTYPHPLNFRKICQDLSSVPVWLRSFWKDESDYSCRTGSTSLYI